MRVGSVVGGAVGMFIGAGVPFGLDALATHSAISKAETGLEQLADCESGVLPTGSEQVTYARDHLAQVFRCGENLVIMAVNGPDWNATREHTVNLKEQSYINGDQISSALPGVLGALVGGAIGTAVSKSHAQNKRKVSAPRTVF